jgi:hypothetical protein
LAALLPRRAIPINPPGQTKIGNTDLTQAHAVGIAAILICFLIGAIWATASRPSLAQADEKSPAASTAVVAPMPPPHHAQ